MGNTINTAKPCKCGRKPILTFGERLVRAACPACGIGTKASVNLGKAVERWNGGRLEKLDDRYINRDSCSA